MVNLYPPWLKRGMQPLQYMRNLREEFLRGFLPDSAYNFLFSAMSEERHGDIQYKIIVPDDSEIQFEEVDIGNKKES